MEIRNDFKELLECFLKNDVRFIVVGAFALAWHGHPRYTGDIDLLVESTDENAQKIVQALRDFGFASVGLQVQDFVIPNQVIQLGVAPVRIDLLTSLSGVSWTDAWQGADQGNYGEVKVRYLGRREYITNKKACGRLQDLADLERLGESFPPNIT